MAETTQENTFLEFDQFNKTKSAEEGAVLFQNWNPFNNDQFESKPSLEELYKEKEAELESREKQLEACKEQLQRKDQELTEELHKISLVINEFEKIKKTHWEVNLKEIVEFSIALAEKVVLQKIEHDPSILTGQIKVVLETIKSGEIAKVNLSPEDLKFLQDCKKPEVIELLKHKNITWNGDMRLSRSEVYIDTQQYRLDASLKTVIHNMKENLLTETKSQELESKEKE